jgi:exosortase/archaeosortase family protein
MVSWFINQLTDNYPQLNKFKPGIYFIARLFFVCLFFVTLKLLYNFFADSHGILQLPFIEPYSPIETLRNFLLNISRYLLHLFGYDTFLNGWVLGIKNGGAIQLETPCLGINICFAFIALMTAYPSGLKWHYKALIIIAGTLLIQGLNIMRIIGMIFVVHYRYSLPVEQHDLFNMIVYLVIFFMFYSFIQVSHSTASSAK